MYLIYVVKNVVVVVVANECCLFNLLRFMSCNYSFVVVIICYDWHSM